MRLQLLSDLHLEQDPDRHFEAAPGASLLVLAGDVGSYQAGSRLAGRDDSFGLRRFSPRRPGAPWPRVLYVPGNHEYDRLPYAATRERLRQLCAELGIDWLDREVRVIDGVRFLGCTLWSDFDALASPQALALKAQAAQAGLAAPSDTTGRGRPPPGQPTRRTLRRALREAAAAALDPLIAQERQRREREKAFRAADFYLQRHSPLDADGAPMLAARLRELALADQAWLRAALAEPHDGATVVVTHFAPSLRSADPRYGLTPGTAGFCNALDDLFEQADLWLHGHLHCALDYRVGRCCVRANPLGYAHKGEQAGFLAQAVITL
ncbi:MAG: metallophosphoesterase [Burkholderiaceae bacterium]|nr:metallophosphoesterase [Burkholderiaceae bacterium]